MRGVVALAIFWVVEPIGKGIDGAATGSSARESAEPMSKSKSLSLPVQSTPKNPNAAPAIKEPQKTTVSRERDAPGGRHRGRAIACDERRCADAIRTMSKPSDGSARAWRPSRCDGGQNVRHGGRPSRYWERGVKRRAILRPGFSLAMKFLSLVIYDFALYRGKVYRTFAAK